MYISGLPIDSMPSKRDMEVDGPPSTPNLAADLAGFGGSALHFIDCLVFAMAAYPEARVEVTERSVILRPILPRDCEGLGAHRPNPAHRPNTGGIFEVMRAPIDSNIDRRNFHGPQPIAAATYPSITRSAFSRLPPSLAQLLDAWPSIIGPTLAAVTNPRQLAQGTLTIGCSGPMAMELQHLSRLRQFDQPDRYGSFAFRHRSCKGVE